MRIERRGHWGPQEVFMSPPSIRFLPLLLFCLSFEVFHSSAKYNHFLAFWVKASHKTSYHWFDTQLQTTWCQSIEWTPHWLSCSQNNVHLIQCSYALNQIFNQRGFNTFFWHIFIISWSWLNWNKQNVVGLIFYLMGFTYYFCIFLINFNQ